ncbi:hypothetical protein [Haloarcula marina]|uniref:hypothetical protein n=1 Tax=Haloarcula marina TaxID=2961574 RepID=UPI0020B64D65|nr:hypothetical protein [Halomicroarcula marina]
MGDRTPYRQRVDEDLQEFVDGVAEQTNLSKADVMDTALRRLKEQSTVTDDGAFEIDDYEVDGDGAGRDRLDEMLDQQRVMMEKQDEMMEMVGGTPSDDDTSSDNIFSAEDSQTDSQTEDGEDVESDMLATVSEDDEASRPPDVLEASETIESIDGEMTTDEKVDPDVVRDLELKEDIAKTHEQCIPTIRAMVNHIDDEMDDSRVVGGQTDWDTLERLITSELGLSSYTARYSYRPMMEAEGVIYSHPSSDDEIVGEEAYEDVLSFAVDKWGDVHPSEIEHPECYPDDVIGFVSWAMPATNWDLDSLYVDEEAYLEQVWAVAEEIIRSIAATQPSDNRPYGEKMTASEKIRGAKRVVVLMAKRAEQLVGRFDSHPVIALVSEAADTDPSSEDDVAEFVSDSSEYVEQIEEMVFESGDDDTVEIDRDEVAGVVGVSPDASDQELHAAAIRALKERHPDKAESDDEALGPAEMEVVMDAMHAL